MSRNRLEMLRPWGLAVVLAGVLAGSGAAAGAAQPDPVKAVAEARAAFDSIDTVLQPQTWASAQARLGAALAAKGQSAAYVQESQDDLAESRRAFEAAMTVITRDAFPAEWALMQANLVNVDLALASRQETAAAAQTLRRAAATDRMLIEACPRGGAPAQWAAYQARLGVVLRLLSERLDGEERLAALNAAIAAGRASLEVQTPASAPDDWTETQINLGAAYRALADLSDAKAELLDQSVGAYGQALTTRTLRSAPREWMTLTFNVAVSEAEAAQIRRDVKAMRRAMGRLDEMDRYKGPEAVVWTEPVRINREGMKKALANISKPLPPPAPPAATPASAPATATATTAPPKS